MNSLDTVFSLLRSALWGGECQCSAWSDGRWEEVYEIAVDQGVHTLLFDAFHPGCVPPGPLLARWVMDIERVEAVSSKMESAAGELSSLWDESGIAYAILKGQAIARLYPHPAHRLSGDIDFYFPDPEGWEKARKKASRMSATSTDSDGDLHYLWKGIVVEHHRGWTHLSSRKARGLEARIEDGGLCPEDTLLMLSSHILRHALVGGVGLRQVVDLAVAVRSLDGRYDREALARKMASLGLQKWAALLSALLSSRLGVPEGMLPVAPDGRYLDRFIDMLCRDGNLGQSRPGLLSGLFRRLDLFLRICPGELAARWWSLSIGRVKRSFFKTK